MHDVVEGDSFGRVHPALGIQDIPSEVLLSSEYLASLINIPLTKVRTRSFQSIIYPYPE